MNPQTRRSPRFPFIAIAEVNDTASATQVESRVSTLSLNGCYVETPNTLPVGSNVRIKIFAEAEHFQANATVIYANPNLGMGLAFVEVSLSSGVVLRSWLDRASKTAM